MSNSIIDRLFKRHKDIVLQEQVDQLLKETSGTAKDFYVDENNKLRIKNRKMRRAEMKKEGRFKPITIKI